jgi:hypothetical protein
VKKYNLGNYIFDLKEEEKKSNSGMRNKEMRGIYPRLLSDCDWEGQSFRRGII